MLFILRAYGVRQKHERQKSQRVKTTEGKDIPQSATQDKKEQ